MDTLARQTVFVAPGLPKTCRMGEIEVHAVRGVDFDIYGGEFVVLLGPSASGKSTLLNIEGGLDTPSGASAVWHDLNLTRYDEAELTRYRREHVDLVFQFYNLISRLTARENVALVTEMSDNPIAPEEALALVGFRVRLDHSPSQMSGGEQRRVAIAREVAKGPTCYCATSPPARPITPPANRCWR